jgi:phosphodiesterase/alkaline phosphatase D-like protein
MLNERLFRSKVYPAGVGCPGEKTDPIVPTSAPSGSARTGVAAQAREGGEPTMLGAKQKRWFKQALRRSPANWKAVANPLMIMALEVPRGMPLNDDQWDGFAAERREIVSHIRDRSIENVSFFTGDIHTFFAGDLSPSGRADEPAVATEFVCGSMTSLGTLDCFAATATGAVGGAIGEGVLRTNDPHIQYSELEHRGYGVMEASSDELVVEFRAPATTLRPESPVSTLKRMRVASGTPHVEVD